MVAPSFGLRSFPAGLGLLLLALPVAAQESEPVADVRTRLAALEAELEQLQEQQAARHESNDLPAELGAQLDEIETSYRASLDSARAAELRSIEWLTGLEQAQHETEAVRAELERPEFDVEPYILPSMSLEAVLQGLAVAEARRAALVERATALAGAKRLREERRASLPEELATTRGQLEAARSISGAAVPEGTDERMAELVRRAHAARLRELQATLAALENELASLAPREELENLQTQLGARRIQATERTVAVWKRAADERRQRETMKASKEVEASETREGTVHPVLREEAVRNSDLARARFALVQAREEYAGELEQARTDMAKVEAAKADAERRSAAAGRSGALGVLLRREKAELPSLRDYRRRLSRLETRLADVQLARFDWENDLEQLAAERTLLDQLVARLPAGSPATQQVEGQARELLQTRRALLTRLLDESERHVQDLNETEDLENKLVSRVEAFSAYINERVLWIRSAPPIWSTSFADVARGLLWLIHPWSWAEVGRSLWRATRQRTELVGLSLLTLAWMVYLRHRMRVRLQRAAEATQAAHGGSLRPTLDALLATLVLAVPLPGFLALALWLMSSDLDAADFPRALAAALRNALPLVALLELLRQLWRPAGVAEGHFAWPAVAARRMRMRVLSLSAPLFAVALMFEAHSVESWRWSLGRLALVGALGILAWFAVRSAPSAALFGWRGAWTRHVWGLSGATFLMLALAALAGYAFTALEFVERYALSAWIVLVAALVHAFVTTWLLVVRRHLARRQELERRRAEHAEDENKSLEDKIEIDPEAGMDLAEVDQQSRTLLNFVVLLAVGMSLAAAWAEVLPALSALDSVPIYPSDPESITWWDLVRALLIGAVTYVAGRNVPGFLEVAVLQRVRMGAGERYALTTVVRYAIVVVGLVAAFGAIGVDWAKVQWLAAAVTVGLGFGMQEIFANFVSGLILLLERPIRVGDWVTIGDINGRVARIQMRATNIIDRDRKELIVPNKDFVTGRLINWTLSDSISRVIIPVGVAYGSDTDKATRILLEIARRDPNVLAEPAPSVVFMAFGDSALNLELRAFIDDRDKYPAMLHPINTAIHTQFAQAGIEIAFPQRDLHLRSAPALEPFFGRGSKK